MFWGHRNFLALAVAIGMLTATELRAQASDSTKPGIAGGLAFTAELDSSLDSKKLKAGDPVVARSTEALKVQGTTILPSGTRLVGHVVQAQARSKGDQDSLIAIQFDKAVLKHKEEVAVSLVIRAMARERRNLGDDSTPGQDPTTDRRIGTTTSPMASPPPPRPQENPGAAGAGNEPQQQAGIGLGPDGRLTPTSRGVYGLEGLRLAVDGSKTPPVSVIISTGKSAHVDSGTRLLFFTQAADSAASNP